jgi:hypothetical protein
LDYVRFQLLATPMTILLQERTSAEHQSIIASVAAGTEARSSRAMLQGDRFTFPQQAYVALCKSSC